MSGHRVVLGALRDASEGVDGLLLNVRSEPLRAGSYGKDALADARLVAAVDRFLTRWRTGVEVGGVALDATGVGLPLGLGLGTASTAGIVTGVGIAGAAGVSLAANALGPDRVQVFHADADPGAAATPSPPFPPPTRIDGRTKHGQERIDGSRGDGGVNDEALEDAVANPTEPPEYRPDRYGGSYRYIGKDAVVNLNSRGEVISAWPDGEAGRRIPR